MGFVLVNESGYPYKGSHRRHLKVYTERGAKGMCTKLNNAAEGTWKVMSLTDFQAIPVKMVERTNLMTGQKYMEPEDTPIYCSPAFESYWSM